MILTEDVALCNKSETIKKQQKWVTDRQVRSGGAGHNDLLQVLHEDLQTDVVGQDVSSRILYSTRYNNVTATLHQHYDNIPKPDGLIR